MTSEILWKFFNSFSFFLSFFLSFCSYLGENEEEWKQHDATELVSSYSGPSIDILMDTGTDDDFLKNQLQPLCGI